MSNIADDADVNVTKHLESTIASRKQYGKWDGKDRTCLTCGDEIPLGRLQAVNATLCITCVSYGDS